MTKENKEQMVRTAEEMAASNYSQGDRERHSASIYRQLANEVCPKSVRMVEDVPANHESGWLPILDTKMAVVGGCIVHQHYSKPMASMELVLVRSAMGMVTKINILVQEGNRKMRNCSMQLPWEVRLRYINRLMAQMMWSGNSQSIREVVAGRLIAKTH